MYFQSFVCGLAIKLSTTVLMLRRSHIQDTVPALKFVYTLLFRLFDKLVSLCIGARNKGLTIEILLVMSYPL
jgi:hypothetical protein